VLQTVADRTRLRILNILIRAQGAPVCVCEFVPELGLTQPTVSYHLEQLRDAGLLERERRGAFSYYRLVPGVLERVQALLAGPLLRGRRSGTAPRERVKSGRPGGSRS
jgi:ArsR family transcriptional regulator, arsenate/arsenite/antimonite-responsive transcriptional repressor